MRGDRMKQHGATLSQASSSELTRQHEDTVQYWLKHPTQNSRASVSEVSPLTQHTWADLRDLSFVKLLF